MDFPSLYLRLSWGRHCRSPPVRPCARRIVLEKGCVGEPGSGKILGSSLLRRNTFLPHVNLGFAWIKSRLGARTHNLKNVNLDLPRQFAVVTRACPVRAILAGLRYPYAEGQRRYVESLSLTRASSCN